MVVAVSATGKLVLAGRAGSRGYAQMSGASTSVAPYPRFGLWFQTEPNGEQSQLPGPSTWANAAAYPFLLFGGNYGGGTPTGYTRDQCVRGCKNYVSAGTVTAVSPIIYQYTSTYFHYGSAAADNTPVLWNLINVNNWWLYASGSAGSIVAAGDGFTNQVNPCQVVGTDKTGFLPGGYAGQAFAKWDYVTFIAGTGGDSATVGASTAFDGIWTDGSYPYLNAAGDWLRIGSSQSVTNQAASNAFQQALVDYAAYGNENYSTYQWGGNTSYAYGTIGLSLSGAIQYQKLAGSTAEYLFGNAVNPQAVESWGGIATAISWLQATDNSTKPATPAFVSGAYKTSDYQLVAHDLCLTLVFSGCYLCGAMTSGGTYEQCSGMTPSNYIVCDELWGGLNGSGSPLPFGGYLGVAIDPPQTYGSPWNGTIYRRRFTNGTVYVNCGTASSGPYSLGGTYYHLRGNGTYGQSINDHSSTSTLTLGTFAYTGSTATPTLGQACILMNYAT